MTGRLPRPPAPRCTRARSTRCTSGSSKTRRSVLSDKDAAKADAVLAEVAGSLTFGKLRSAAHRLVLELDPESAARRKEAAKRDAHVRRVPGRLRQRRDGRPRAPAR